MQACLEKACLSAFRSRKSPGWSSGSALVQRPSKLCFEPGSFSGPPKDNRTNKLLTNSNCSDAPLRSGATGFVNKESVEFGILLQAGDANRFMAKPR